MTQPKLEEKIEELLTENLMPTERLHALAAHVREETLREKFNLNELDKDWLESFYEDAWNCDTMNFTETEEAIVEELSWFLPRHMMPYDWNLPFAETVILIVRNILSGKKIITGKDL